MNIKIKNYVDVLFSDIPMTKKAKELREELLSNMNERFEDYINDGKSEYQAYSMVIANLGDVDEMLKEVMPDENYIRAFAFHRNKRAIITAVAVAFYILSPMVLVLIAEGSRALGFHGDLFDILGIMCMFTLIALATGLLIYNRMSSPAEFKPNNQEELVFTKSDGKQEKIIKNFKSIYWMTIALLFFVIGIYTNLWHIIWLIFIVAYIGMKIFETYLELKE